MLPMAENALYIFRRDLRLEDNRALMRACDEAHTVIPVFIFDPRQCDNDANEYFSSRAFRFLLASLGELADDIAARGAALGTYRGIATDVLAELIQSEGINAVYCARDYTPFSYVRDDQLRGVCEKHSVSFTACDDVALSPVDEIRTKDGEPYSVFTPFYKNAATHSVDTPKKFNYTNLAAPQTASTCELDALRAQYRDSDQLVITPGREAAREILRDLSLLKTYATHRNLPGVHGTSRLSPHLKFGTVSIREVYHEAAAVVGTGHSFISELYWRDFWLHIAHHFPHVFSRSFYKWGDIIAWENNEEQFTAWKAGKTGVPMVDAGMRELNATGWMHNRARMIVASFLTKNLLIDWRWGERYFATQLIDYDPSSNNGNWQWGASVGADPRPLRIFNPYTQAEKFDPEGTYIKRWVPELADVSVDVLTNGKETNFSTCAPDYPAPIISVRETYHRARETYKRAKG